MTYAELVNFLNHYKYTDIDKNHTHTSYGSFYGKFKIPHNKSKQFIKLYIKAIESGVTDLSILEVQSEYSPIIIDIDLKSCYDNNNDRLYNDDLIIEVIENYKKVINEYLKINNSKSKIFVFEKNQKTVLNEICKDGFHILFPDIITDIGSRHMIRHKVIELCKEENIFEEFLENVDKIIDKAVVSSNGWFLYGSKKPNGHLYKLTKIYE